LRDGELGDQVRLNITAELLEREGFRAVDGVDDAGRADHGVQAAQPVHRVRNGTASTVVVDEIGGHGGARSRQVDADHLRTRLAERSRQRPAQPARGAGEQHAGALCRHGRPFAAGHEGRVLARGLMLGHPGLQQVS
jgi:hypothetical protein